MPADPLMQLGSSGLPKATLTFPGGTAKYLREDGTFQTPPGSGTPSYSRVTGGTTFNGTYGNVVVYSTVAESGGSDLTYQASGSGASEGATLVNTSGIYAVSCAAAPNNASTPEIRVGSAVDNANEDGNTRAPFRADTGTGRYSSAWTGYIPAGSYVWLFVNSSIAAGVNVNQMTIS